MNAAAPRCRACGSTHLAARGRKRGKFIAHDYDFFSCRDCGLLFVEPFSGFEIYNEAYYRGEGPDPFVDYESEYRDWRATDRVLEFDDLARLAESFLAARPPQAPVAWLDFGCGAGGLLKFLRERGRIAGQALELSGHDVGSYAARLQSADGFRILDLEQIAREPDGRYDVISMIEVIEHLPSPSEPLALVSRLLKPGGLLLLTTGNLDCPVARRDGIHYRYCMPEVHVSLFSPASLTALYRRHGLEPHFFDYRGVVSFKVVKSLRHHRLRHALAGIAMRFPPMVALVDWLYGVSKMPCAVKPVPKA